MIRNMNIQYFPEGSNIISEGEDGDTYYMILSGKAEVTKRM
jgi:CRP-like cAMP-binding protein